MTTQLETPPKAPNPDRSVRTLAPLRPNTIAATLVVGALLIFGLWAVGDLGINVQTLIDSVGLAQDFISRATPLDFPPFAETAILLGQTLAIVISATVLSMLLSTPLAFWAAANTSTHLVSRLGSRGVIVVARAIPDIVLAIIFVRIFGLGILPGVLAMGLHSIGMIGKLYADAIEQIDEGPRTALRAAGATRRQQLIGGVLPQVLPAFVATAMHRLDINLRISVLLGYVGVAGIGKEIKDAFESLRYPRALALALILLVLIVIMELISGAIRKMLLGPAGAEPSRFGLLRPLRWLGRKLTGRGKPDHKIPAARSGPSATTRSKPSATPVPTRISPPWTPRRVRRFGYMFLGLAVIAVSVAYVVVDFTEIGGGVGVWETLARLVPPGTGGVGMETLWISLFETFVIAIAALLIGLVLALPIGCLAARNVAPNSVVAKGFRMFIVGVRGVPELVLAILFVIIIGLGPVAAALALSIGAIGLLGKLVADSIEEVDPGVEQALRATGASRIRVFFAATLPQALPAFIGHILYQLDVNFRAATILGVVGGGGIGYYLLQAARVREFETVTTITLMIFGVVMVIELIAMWLRKTAGAKSGGAAS